MYRDRKDRFPVYVSHCIGWDSRFSKRLFSLIFLGNQILFQFPKRIGLLGRGAYKNVVAAVNVETGQLYASAGLIPPDLRETTFLKKFSGQGCVKLIASMVYPHCGKKNHEGRFKQRLILEYFPANLYQVLLREKKLTPREQKRIFEGLVRAVANLHRQDTIHRDIKPNNILLDEELNPKLADFGATCDIGEAEERRQHKTTCEYASYDYAHAMMTNNSQLRLEASNCYLDSFSLGITLAQVLYMDRPPWQEIKDEERVFRLIHQTPNWPVFKEEYSQNSPQAYVCRLTARNPSEKLSVVDLEKQLPHIVWKLESEAEEKS